MFPGLPTASLTLTNLFSAPFHFSVPCYQRPYSWTTTEAGQLLEDILGAAGLSGSAGSEEPDYFLGTIILIDGAGGDLPQGARSRPAPVRDHRRSATPCDAGHDRRRPARSGDRAVAVGRAQSARPAHRRRFRGHQAARHQIPRGSQRPRAGIPRNLRADARRLLHHARRGSGQRGRGAAPQGARRISSASCPRSTRPTGGALPTIFAISATSSSC